MNKKNPFLNNALSVRMTRMIIYGVSALGVLLTISATWSSAVNTARLEDLEFDKTCRTIQQLIAERLDHHALILWSGAALFSASDIVLREEWRHFIHHLKIKKQLLGIQGLGFIVLIPRDELARHTQKIRSEGFPAYQVHPAGDRESYSSVLYLEPFSGRHVHDFGYDMLSEPVCRAAMEQARDTDAAVLSAKMVLMNETDPAVQAESLMVLPVYRNGLPTETVEQRRAAIRGWVYSPYRMNDLLHEILKASNGLLERVKNLEVFDGQHLSAERLLFAAFPVQENLVVDGRRKKRLPVDFNGHRWTLDFTQKESGLWSPEYVGVWLTLLGWSASTLLVCMLLCLLLNTRLNAQQVAEAMDEKLKKSEDNFQTFFETMTDMLLVATPDGRILHANAALARTLGYTSEELCEMRVLELRPAEMRQQTEANFAAMFRGERESCPLPWVCKDGSRVPVETRIWLGLWNGEKCLFGVSKNLSIEQEANQRFERLFQNNPCPIAYSSFPGRQFIDVNKAFLLAHGYTREEVIGNSSAALKLFAKEEQREAVAEILRTEGRIANFEVQVRRKDGSLLDGLFYGEVFSSQGQQFLLAVMTDITARKEAEQELARISVIQRALMRLATEFVNVPLERQDEAIDQSLETMARLIHADRAYLFSYDFKAEVLTNTHEWCDKGVEPIINNLQAVAFTMFADWVAVHRRGERIHVPYVAALPKEDHFGQHLALQGIQSVISLPLMLGAECLGFVGFHTVQQERHWNEEEIALLQVLAELYAHFESRRNKERQTQELQKRLTEARDAAQEAAVAKSLFLGNMAHEIRTPLNVILGYTQIMERECLVQACPMSKKLSSITRSGEHLLELLNDLLELVRSDSKEIKLATGVFDFYQVLEDVRLIFVRHPAAQVLTLQVSHEPEVPRFICSDSGKVRQVLVNLVDNALKFTERGGVRLSASLLSDSASETLTLAVDVEDTGCGMRPEEQEHLFELFYTHTERGGKAPKGTGLGLPLCRRYARALGGDVTLIRSTPAGSCFRFTLQIRAADPAAIEQQNKGVVRRLAPNQPPCRVLVVDDDSANREMLVDLLEPLGITVETDSSAEDALNRLRKTMAFDLVLMDKRMPEMDGYEAIRQLREMPGGEKIAVYVVSASGSADEQATALAAGADGYISKPVRREKVLEAIGRVTGLQFEYEAGSAGVPKENEHPVLDVHAMSRVPAELRQLLSQALHRGDIQQLRGLVETLERDHAEVASGIRILVDAYDYDRLRHLIEASPPPAVL